MICLHGLKKTKKTGNALYFKSVPAQKSRKKNIAAYEIAYKRAKSLTYK